MAISVYKTFSAGEVLTASDLNLSLAQFVTNEQSIGTPRTASFDMAGQSLILDADDDTLILADNDDIVDFDIGGLASAVQFTHLASGGVTTVTIQDDDADAGQGPTLVLWRNSASPADSDVTGAISFEAENDNDEQTVFARIGSAMLDVSDGTEDGRLTLASMVAGTVATRVSLDEALVFSGLTNVALASDGDLTLTDDDGGDSAGPVLDLYRNSASPANGDTLGILEFNGEESADAKVRYGAIFVVADTVTSGSEDSTINFRIIDGGSAINTMSVAHDGIYTNTASGGGQGVGTINADAVFDDGTGPLTDYVLDYAANGKIDLDLYDEASVWATGRNEPARRFMANTDELDIDTYLSKCLTNLTLPSMPTLAERLERKHALGELVQGLWEAAEVGTVQRGYLHERVKRLEERLEALAA